MRLRVSSYCDSWATVCAVQFADLRRETNDVKAALEVRKLPERAKHVLIQRLSLTEEDAYCHMRHKCRNQNKTNREVSEEILAAEEAFLAGLAKDPPKRQSGSRTGRKTGAAAPN